jgi:hypothetical protein
MKKLILMCAVALVSVAVVNARPWTWGVKAGVNASNITNLPQMAAETPIGMAKTAGRNTPGFHVGVTAQYFFTRQFGLEGGLFYTRVGAKQEMKVSTNDYFLSFRTSRTPAYLQLPITAFYRFDAGSGFFLYPQAGFYLGCGTGGKVRTTLKTNMTDLDRLPPGLSTTDAGYFGDNNRRFDAGLSFGLNLQYHHALIGVGYDLGLATVNSTGADNHRNTNLKVSLGYMF